MSNGFDFLFDLGLRPGLGLAELAPIVLIITALLAYASYTDIFRGQIIPNGLTGALFLLTIAAIPLLFEDHLPHLALGLIPVLFSFGLVVIGGQGGGDFKLYCSLGPLLGPAGVALFFLSALVTLVYALPLGIANYDRQAQFGHRMGHAPAGPGIALAFPITLVFLGLPLGYGAALIALQVVLVAAFWRWSRPGDKPGAVWPQASID